MIKYIVIGNYGWYVDNIKQNNPMYSGVDRFPWPLEKNDLMKIYNLIEDNKRKKALICNMNSIEYPDNTYSKNYDCVKDYFNLCKILHLEVELYMMISGDDIFSVDEKNIFQKGFSFVGYDYILKNSTYSSIIHEKNICDNEHNILLNENGLFENYLDVCEYSKLRNCCERSYIGFEKGNYDEFEIIKLYKYIEI